MNQMHVRFWGTRGSIPTPGRRTEKYGGNTTCLQVQYGDTMIILDAGSGIRELSSYWMRNHAGESFDAHLLLTHLHWDHIQGFPFFVPAYVPGNRLRLYGERRPAGALVELLNGQMEGDYFPVPLKAMQAELEFHDTSPRFEIGPIQVSTMPLPHPGGCLGYRFEVDGHVFVFATDSEVDLIALNRDELEKDFHAPRQHEPEFIDFLKGANLLLLDCQYTDEEYATRRGWGHNSVAAAADLIAQVTPDMVALSHHDPENDDGAVTAMVADTIGRVHAQGSIETLVFGAREGMVLNVAKPLAPLAIAT